VDVNEDELPQNKIFDAKAVVKRGNNENVRAMGKGEFDLVIGIQCSNQPKEDADLITKAMKNLVARPSWRRTTIEAGWEAPNQRRGGNQMAVPRHNMPMKRTRVLFLQIFVQQGQCRPQLGGWHLHGSPAHAHTCW
jgi:hypothetical protein